MTPDPASVPVLTEALPATESVPLTASVPPPLTSKLPTELLAVSTV